MRVLVSPFVLGKLISVSPLDLDPETRVSDVRSQIVGFLKHSLPRQCVVEPRSVRIFYSGSELADYDTFGAYGVVENSRLHVVCSFSTPPGLVDAQERASNVETSSCSDSHPRIEDLEPAQGLTCGGQTVKLRGRNFQNHSNFVVMFGAVSVPFHYLSLGLLTCVSPPHAPGIATVRICLKRDESSNSLDERCDALPSEEIPNDKGQIFTYIGPQALDSLMAVPNQHCNLHSVTQRCDSLSLTELALRNTQSRNR
mmetsp:Transcript_163/g.317  ORF Transcript_163/g.317 Transcript_163/m.317 type:complete len:255 (+) Transcript_163:69-833(+)